MRGIYSKQAANRFHALLKLGGDVYPWQGTVLVNLTFNQKISDATPSIRTSLCVFSFSPFLPVYFV